MAVPELDSDTYDHLRSLARRIYATRGMAHATVQPTVLLHEAWLKIQQGQSTFDSRVHFFAIAAQAMRQILIDRARAKATAKRGDNPVVTTLSGIPDAPRALDLLELEQAIEALTQADERAADIAVMRTFGGLTVPEIAQATGRPERTVRRSWRFARAFLGERLEP